MTSKGFTMLELLVVISVIAILMSVSFYGYNAKKDKLILNDEVNNIVGQIEHMREMAIASQEWQNPLDPQVPAVLPSGGYGVAIEKNSQSITLIGDFDINDGTFTPNDPSYYGDVIGHVSLNHNVIIKGLTSDTSPSDWIVVLYKFPFPNAQIKDNTNNTFSQAHIIVGLKNDPSQQKTITLNSAGIVYAQ